MPTGHHNYYICIVKRKIHSEDILRAGLELMHLHVYLFGLQFRGISRLYPNGWQGALLRMKAGRNAKSLELFIKILFDKILV
jgi:hypothetical protein